MNYAGSGWPTTPRQDQILDRKMVDECVGECPLADAGSGVCDHAGRLVDDDYRVVLVDDGERDGGGLRFERRARQRCDLHLLAGGDWPGWLLHHHAIDRHLACLDCAPNLGPTRCRDTFGNVGVEPCSGRLNIDQKMDRLVRNLPAGL